MRFLKQSTSVDLPIGPFLDSTDGITAETSLTITQPDIRLKKNGGAWAQKAAAQTLSHEENGYYEVTLDATDTDTLGLMRLAVHETGAIPVWEDFMVMPANVWDALFGADKLQVDLSEISGASVSASTAQLGVNVVNFGGSAGTFSSGRPEVNASHWAGAATATNDVALITAPANFASLAIDGGGRVSADTVYWGGAPIATPTNLGVPEVDVTYINGTTADAASGVLNVNAIQISGDATAANNLEAALDGTGGVTITAGLTGNITGNLSGSVGSVTGAVGSIGANGIAATSIATGAITAAKFAASAIDAAALSTDAAQEIRDAVITATLTELTADPGANPEFGKALNLLYMALRNKRDTTASADEIHNSAGVVILTATVSDDGTTFTKAKYA